MASLTTATARTWAETILRQLGDPRGHTLRVTHADPAWAPEPVSGVTVTLAASDGSSVSVLLEESMTEADAVTLLADQLQDTVLENTAGTPAPPCPGSPPAPPPACCGAGARSPLLDLSRRPRHAPHPGALKRASRRAVSNPRHGARSSALMHPYLLTSCLPPSASP